MVKVSSSRLITTTGQELMFATSATTARATLGLGSAATLNAGTVGSSIIQSSDASSSRSTLGLGTAATQASTAFESAGAISSAISTHNGVTTAHGISSLGASIVSGTTASGVRSTIGASGLGSTGTITISTNANCTGTTNTGMEMTWSLRTAYCPTGGHTVSVASGNIIRIQFEVCGTYNFTHVAIVERSSSLGQYVGATIPTVFTFNGSQSISGNATTTITSDWIPFAFDKDKRYLVILDKGATFHVNGTTATTSNPEGYRMWGWTSASTYNVADPGTPDYWWEESSYMFYYIIQTLQVT